MGKDGFATVLDCSGTCLFVFMMQSFGDKYDQWWYFLDHPEVPPDNNLAERSLQLAVTKRKISGGSRSLCRFGHTQVY